MIRITLWSLWDLNIEFKEIKEWNKWYLIKDNFQLGQWYVSWFLLQSKPSLICEILTNILVLCILYEYYIPSQLFYCLFSFNLITNIDNLSGAEKYFLFQKNKERLERKRKSKPSWWPFPLLESLQVPLIF